MNDTKGPPDKSPRRSWLPALLFLWLAGSGSLMAFVFARYTPTYIARSQVKVEIDNPKAFGSEQSRIDFSQFMQNQAATIASPTIVGAALAEHPDLAATPMLKKSEDREGALSSALRIGIVPKTNFIQVEMTSTIPTEAARLVNAVVGAYLNHAQNYTDTSTRRRIDLLKATRAEQEAEIGKQRRRVQSLKDQAHTNTDQEALNKLEYAQKDLQRADAVFDRIVDSLNQYQFAARNPDVRFELNFPASTPIRPDTFRRRELMAASPLAVGLLVFGPMLVMRRGTRTNNPRLE